VEQISFTGSPRFREDGSEFVPDQEKQPQYVGDPSRAMDHAWASLTFGEHFSDVILLGRYFIAILTPPTGRFILLTEEEARQAWGEEYINYWSPYHGGYVAGYKSLPFHI
jgi:hypothetical protein